MGSFVFIWPNAGSEVFVTGTFDAWSKSVQLEKVGGVFQKTVELNDASKKIYYKFVVDGEWVLDPAAPQEKDDEGNDNNVLTPENIIAAAPVAAAISSAAPESTTAALAADAPIEKKAVEEKNLNETPFTILPVTEEPPVAADAPPASVGILSSAAPIATTAALAGAVPLEKNKAVEEKPLDETPVTILPVTDAPVVAEETPASSAAISSAAPVSTTAALAGDVPLESKAVEETPATIEAPTAEETPAPKETSTAADIAAPVTAAAAGVAAVGAAVVATTKDSAKDAKKMSADSDLPGAFPATPADELNKEVKLVNPLPAAPGGVNPVTLAPGEKIPDEFKNGDINANVKLDPESYEKADAAIAGDFSAEQLPPVSKNMIPESSLPIAGGNDVTINSAAPIATTAVLAGAVPLEKEKAAAATAAPAETETVPGIVKESQVAAGVAPEASAVPAEVKEKEQVEDELLKKVPEAPVTSDGTTTEAAAPAAESSSTSPAAIVGGVAAGAAALGAAALGAAAVAKDKAVEQAPVVEKYANDAAAKLPVSVKQLLPTSVQEQLATTSAIGNEPVKSEVPAEVQDSIKQAGTSPEAAANVTAVGEKKAVEAELLKKVDSGAPAESASASAATPAAAAAAPVAPAAKSSSVAPATAAAAAAPASVTESAAAAPAAEAASGTNGKESAPAVVAAPAPAAAPRMAPVGNSAAAAVASASSAPASKAGVVNAEKKKKNRLSGFFHKIMDKIDGDKKK